MEDAAFNNQEQYFLIAHDSTILLKDGAVLVNKKPAEIIDDTQPLAYAKLKTREYYKRFLSDHFDSLVILTGAGSSIGIGTDNKGKTRGELWESVKDCVNEKKLKEFAEKVKYDYPKKNEVGDVEALLSRAYGAKLFIDDSDIEAVTNQIQQQIVKDCTLELPGGAPHSSLLSKLTARKLKYARVKIFTLNYDTLFEQAAIAGGFTVVDGFSFSFPRTFSGRYFDYDLVIRENSRIENEENYVSKLFHLYKPHGSLDWERSSGAVVKTASSKDPLIIYPRDSKYETSYEQPFFEMMARFQQALRSKNSLLITIGFSFYDKHIRAMILEAVNVNPSFRLMVVDPGISRNEHMQDLRNLAQARNNVVLVNEGFADFVAEYPYPESYLEANLAVTGKGVPEEQSIRER